MSFSTVKPGEGRDTPAIWRGVFQLFEEIRLAGPPLDGNGYWRLSPEQMERFSALTMSESEACIIAWQQAYKRASRRETNEILRLPKHQRHLRIVEDTE